MNFIVNDFGPSNIDQYDCNSPTGNPFTASCSDPMRRFGHALYNLEVSIGAHVNSDSTKCSSIQWSASLTADSAAHSYIPIVRCAMRSESPVEVLDCIDRDVSIVASIPCASCFQQLGIEAFMEIQRDEIVRSLCADLYSTGCQTAIMKPLQIFKECSGFNAAIVSNGQCSESALASLSTAGIDVEKVISLITSSETMTEAVYRLSLIRDQLSDLDYPCKYCFMDLLMDYYTLSTADGETCIAGNFVSWDCYMAMGPKLDNFRRCSIGWESAFVAPSRDAYSDGFH